MADIVLDALNSKSIASITAHNLDLVVPASHRHVEAGRHERPGGCQSDYARLCNLT